MAICLAGLGVAAMWTGDQEHAVPWAEESVRHAARSADDFAAAIALERNARTVRGKAVVSVGEGSPQPTLPRRAWAS